MGRWFQMCGKLENDSTYEPTQEVKHELISYLGDCVIIRSNDFIFQSSKCRPSIRWNGGVVRIRITALVASGHVEERLQRLQ